MAYIAATLNPEILKNFPGPVRVGKKKSGSGRVAGTRQGLMRTGLPTILPKITKKKSKTVLLGDHQTYQGYQTHPGN